MLSVLRLLNFKEHRAEIGYRVGAVVVLDPRLFCKLIDYKSVALQGVMQKVRKSARGVGIRAGRATVAALV